MFSFLFLQRMLHGNALLLRPSILSLLLVFSLILFVNSIVSLASCLSLFYFHFCFFLLSFLSFFHFDPFLTFARTLLFRYLLISPSFLLFLLVLLCFLLLLLLCTRRLTAFAYARGVYLVQSVRQQPS